MVSEEEHVDWLETKLALIEKVGKVKKEMYGADASPALISKVTDAVIEEVVEWQSRPQGLSRRH